MKFDQTPHPLTEDHYHIQDLINAQQKRSDDRQYHKDRIKELEQREDLIEDSKPLTLTDFYCSKCKKDFKAQTVKQVEEDWTSNQRIAFYKTKCFRGHWCIRLITDRQQDGFWQRSRLVALDRGKNFNDALQPFEIGYYTLYGKPK